MKPYWPMLLLITSIPPLVAEDWLQFRGNESSGVSRETTLPTQLDSPEVLKWKVDLIGRGLSGPIVIGDRVVLTASSGYRDNLLHVLCFSSTSGEMLWSREFQSTGRTVCHKTMCMATPQPCSDGKHIFAYYSSNDVICLDLEGNLIWYRGLGFDYPNASSSLGMSSSPVVSEGTLVLQLDTMSESYVTGLNALTGETLWKHDRSKAAIWASPALFRSSSNPAPQVILQSKQGLLSISPRSGATNWEIRQECGSIPSTTIADGLLVAPLKALSLLRPTGTQGTPEIVWSEGRLSPNTPTPVALDGKLYVLKGSVLSCADLLTGKSDWQMRLECKNAYASPLAGNGHLFLADEQGVLQTIQLGGAKGVVASRLELHEPILCTPALSNGAFYVRSDQHLWKFSN